LSQITISERKKPQNHYAFSKSPHPSFQKHKRFIAYENNTKTDEKHIFVASCVLRMAMGFNSITTQKALSSPLPPQ